MTTHLRDSKDFERVYKAGQRYEGYFITAFVLPNTVDHHRLGLTASRKALGNAVRRNRAKRLLRETFRLTRPRLDGLQRKYDWVLNGRRTLLSPHTGKVPEEFERIIARVAREETLDRVDEAQLA